MNYVSIDPGKYKVAYAKWDDRGQLTTAGLVILKPTPGKTRVQEWRNMAELTATICWFRGGSHRMIVEIPQIYSDARKEARKEDPNDLLDLAGVVGAIATHVDEVVWSPLPREWKGQIPKEVTQTRVDQKLSDAEKARIIWPAKSLRHNTYDAVHLGLTFLERKGLRQAIG